MKYGIAEILEITDKKELEDKREFFRAHFNMTLVGVLNLLYGDTKAVWKVKEESYTYKPSPYLDLQSALMQKFRYMNRYFLEPSEVDLTLAKTEAMWISFLENVAPEDAVMLEEIRNGRMPYQSITRTILEEALPEYFTKRAPPSKPLPDSVKESSPPVQQTVTKPAPKAKAKKK